MQRKYFGLYGSSKAWLLANLAREFPHIVLVVKEQKAVDDYLADFEFFDPETPVLRYPAWESLPFEAVSPPSDISSERFKVLNALQSEKKFICVTSIESLTQKILPRSNWSPYSFTIQNGSAHSREELKEKFLKAGFQETALVEEVGDVAIRGNVIDVFASTENNPLRIELEGQVISDLRTFDPETQRSNEKIEKALILPVREYLPIRDHKKLLDRAVERIKQRAQALETPPREVATVLTAFETATPIPGIELYQFLALDQKESFFDCVSADTLFIIDDEASSNQALDRFYDLIEERSERFAAEHILFPSIADIYISQNELHSKIESGSVFKLSPLELIEDNEQSKVEKIKYQTSSNIELITRLKTLVGSGRALAPLKQAIERWRRKGFDVAFVVGAQSRAERLQRALLSISVDAPLKRISGASWAASSRRDPVVVLEGHLSSGFSLEKEKIVFIAENEIYPEKSYRRKDSGKISVKRILNSLAQLQSDDYIVHIDYGIGIYRGLQHLEVEGVQGDFLHIDYADSRLYLPVHNISKVQKFFAAEGQRPALDKLSSQRWAKTKIKIRQSVISLAGDLIKLYASRSVSKGWRFEPYGAEDDRFADGFPFNETQDQLKTIRDVISDMAKDRPMDRLVCGDVGFGKTEVALRAAFKCTQHSRQVAVLVPTTILVEQHKSTFESRFADYPIKVAALSRFYSTNQNKETLEQLASGDVDIVIGTHKLLQRDVQFADLGLLIIDEEHRFGVKQKERLKQLKKQVDVLALTATPIPRTLHMSLLDIRDTSVISTPPHDRRAIRTYVASTSDTLVRDAILRELQRGGQCFFLHNRVQSIDVVAGKLAQLVPEARFQFAHGQMSETQLENIMQKFLKHEIDVLVSTTIIESGLDIPNANTIIIDRADTFGLAQLYQLRGRVGRSNKQAYAYFLVPKTQKLGLEAQQRLKVLQSLDELGLGFNLAIRDLEIRGAGNLLGKEQSGNVLSVGFELYTKILKEAVLNLKGEELSPFESVDPEMKLSIPAFIPEFYVPDISERLVLYQRLAALHSSEEADEILDEINDRFGELPFEVSNLVEVMRLRSLLRHYAIARGEISGSKLVLSFTSQSPINADKVFELVKKNPDKVRFSKNLVLSLALEPESLREAKEFYRLVENLLLSIKQSPVNNSNARVSD